MKVEKTGFILPDLITDGRGADALDAIRRFDHMELVLMSSQEVIGFNGSLGIFTVPLDHDDVEAFQKFIDPVPAGENIHLVAASQEVKGGIRILLLNLQLSLVCIALLLAVVLQIIHTQAGVIFAHGVQHLQPQMLRQGLLRALGTFHLSLDIRIGGRDKNTLVGAQCIHSAQQQPLVGNGGGD